MRMLYQLIKDHVPAGLLLEWWQTELLLDGNALTLIISDKPKQFTAKLQHPNHSPGWTTCRSSTLALISDMNEGQLHKKGYKHLPDVNWCKFRRGAYYIPGTKASSAANSVFGHGTLPDPYLQQRRYRRHKNSTSSRFRISNRYSSRSEGTAGFVTGDFVDSTVVPTDSSRLVLFDPRV